MIHEIIAFLFATRPQMYCCRRQIKEINKSQKIKLGSEIKTIVNVDLLYTEF